MNFFSKLGGSIMAGIDNFRQVTAVSQDATGAALFDSYSERLKRYTIGKAYYEGEQYKRSIPLLNQRMINDSLYKHVRPLYNPVARLVSFYGGVIWRGSVDQGAGNKGAIPIEISDNGKVDEKKLRLAIATAFKDSNINKNKNVFVLNGSSLGDAVFYVRDDVSRQQSRLEVVHPAKIESAEFDEYGNVKSYTLVESRLDNSGTAAIYRETCEHGENDDIIFTTYRDRSPYAWDGNVDAAGNLRDSWVEKWGFVPLVCVKHIDEGNTWGKAAFWNAIGAIDSIADLSSILVDGVRKNIDAVILANFKVADADVKFGEPTLTKDKPSPDRERAKVIYADIPSGTPTMTPVSVPVDVVGISAQIQMLLDDLEKQLPELHRGIESANVATDTVLAMRADVESKVIAARVNYDAAIVSALQMAITIGGMGGYEGYKGYNVDSFANGEMDFTVTDRSVFPKSEAEKNAEIAAFFASAASAIQSSQGMITFEMVAKANGWTDEKITEYLGVRAKAISGGEEIPIDPITGERLAQ